MNPHKTEYSPRPQSFSARSDKDLNTRSVPTNTFALVDERMTPTYAQQRYSVIFININGEEELFSSGIVSRLDAEEQKIKCMKQFRTDHGYMNPDDFAVIRM